MSVNLWNVGTNNAINTTLNGSVAIGDTSITLTSATGLQAPGVIVIDRQDANGNNTPTLREYVSFTGIATNTLTGCTRGKATSTAQSHASGAKVEEVLSVTHWNDLISAIENVLTTAGALDTTKVVGVPGSSAQGDVLYHNGTLYTRLGAGTNGQFLQTQGASANPQWATVSSTASDGWVATTAALTYSSTDGHTFVVTTNVDISGSVGVGDRMKFTNNSTTFYGIVTAISSSTITLYGGTTYSVANSAITNPFYSHVKAPVGFNPNPVIWTEVFRDTTDSFQTSPVSTTWYNPGSFSLTIPIGNWRVFYSVIVQSNCTTANAVYASLSTANNSESDSDFTSVNQADSVGSLTSTPYVEKTLALAVKTQYFLICRESGVSTLLGFVGASYRATIIKAICSYL